MNQKLTIAVVIDVFRAFSTASIILKNRPKKYLLTNRCETIQHLANKDSLLVGKPEVSSNTIYDIPNSPSLVSTLDINNMTILHRTVAGAKGVLDAKNSDLILCACFNNLNATIKYIKKFQNPTVSIIPMGIEAQSECMADQVCASYIASMLKEEKIEQTIPFEEIKLTSGAYFFSDNPEYPVEDFAKCLEIDTFNFAIRAKCYGEFAELSTVK